MEVQKQNLRGAEARFERTINNKIQDAKDAAANAMSKSDFDNYEKETDELMRQVLNQELSDEEFKLRMEELENPPSSVNFHTIADMASFLKETEVETRDLERTLADQNGFLNRANAAGLNGRYQLVFFRDENGALRSRPRAVISFPDTMSGKERVELYKKINPK